MAVPSWEVGAQYCTPVLTKPEVFWPGGVESVRHPRFLDVQAQTENRSEGSGLPGPGSSSRRRGRIFRYGVK